MSLPANQFNKHYKRAQQKLDYTTKRLYRMHKERRVVISGFPIEAPLEMKDIDAYYASDEIQCLLCGKFYQSLGGHLSRVHLISPTDYKIMYQLPMGRGLVSESVSKSIQGIRQKDCAETINNRINKVLEINAGSRMKGVKLADRNTTHYLQRTLSNRAKALADEKARKWDAIIPEVMQNYDGSIGLHRFCAMNGIPYGAWRKYKERHNITAEAVPLKTSEA